MVNFTLQPFYTQEKVLGTHWGWVGPRARSRRCGVKQISCLCRESTPAVQPISRRYTDWATRALYWFESTLCTTIRLRKSEVLSVPRSTVCVSLFSEFKIKWLTVRLVALVLKKTPRRYSPQFTASSQNQRLCACCTPRDPYEFCPGHAYFTVNCARRIYVFKYQAVLFPA
jgi:hypothetical protein